VTETIDLRRNGTLTITEVAANAPPTFATSYRLSPSIRMDDTGDAGHALVHDLDDRRLLRVDLHCRVVIELFRRPRTLGEAIRDAGWRATPAWWTAVLDQLTELRILVVDQPSGEPAAVAARQWCAEGWEHAADYLRATYDFPFVDYSQDAGHRIDRARMAAYVEKRPDVERTKRYPNAGPTAGEPTVCESTVTALGRLHRPLGEVLGRAEAKSAVPTADTLKTVMTVAFGRLRGRTLRQPGRAPAIRRTSPSGGSRHPTEGYLLTGGIQDLPDGLHHFSTTEYTLTRIGRPTIGQLREALHRPGAPPPDRPFAVVIATSVFERNMYRYREPRTFRSVHLDVGHVVSTVELAAAHESVSAERLYRVDYGAIDAMVGIDPYVEATVCVVMIGGAA
jgi:SagB-type dehydrogenase family enzyme